MYHLCQARPQVTESVKVVTEVVFRVEHVGPQAGDVDPVHDEVLRRLLEIRVAEQHGANQPALPQPEGHVGAPGDAPQDGRAPGTGGQVGGACGVF
jgi:hypothetical protein